MYKDIKERLHSRATKKVANNTYLYLEGIEDTPSERVTMTLHGHSIGIATEDYVQLSACGWHTPYHQG